MPPLEPEDLCGSYLAMLFELGPAMSGGMGGGIAVSWQELDAWCRRTDQHLTPMEAKLLRQLSQVYASAAHSMSEHDAQSPWLQERIEIHERKQQAIKTAFDRMIRLNKRK